MSDLICPRCSSVVLEQCEHNGREVDVCSGCGGMWVQRDAASSSHETSAERGDVALLKDIPTTFGTETEMSCPCCDESPKLTEVHVDDVRELTVDICSACNGFWFDHKEWDHLEACRSWKQLQQKSQKTSAYVTWVFQLLTGMPAEFNIRPRRLPVVTITIMLLCSALFLLMVNVPGVASWAESLGAKSGRGSLQTMFNLFSNLFVHAGWLHLLGNMYFLYVLGDNVEDVMGRRRYVLFFLGCGALAVIPHLLMGSGIMMVGASGAIAAVMGAYFVLFPHAEMTVMWNLFHVRVNARMWLGGWMAFQLFCLWGDPTSVTTGIGWSAHVIGFIAGFAVTHLWRKQLVDSHPFLHLVETNRLHVLTDKKTTANEQEQIPTSEPVLVSLPNLGQA